MKKALTLILTVILLTMPLAVLADDGFMMLASTLMQDGLLGEPDNIQAAEGFETDNVTVLVQVQEGNFLIVGRTDENELIGCYWEGCEPARVLSLIYAMCVGYEELAANCEHGLDIVVWASAAEDSESFQVSDPETAALVVALLGLDETAEDTGTAVEEPAATEAE